MMGEALGGIEAMFLPHEGIGFWRPNAGRNGVIAGSTARTHPQSRGRAAAGTRVADSFSVWCSGPLKPSFVYMLIP